MESPPWYMFYTQNISILASANTPVGLPDNTEETFKMDVEAVPEAAQEALNTVRPVELTA
jgi:hypothetical protein